MKKKVHNQTETYAAVERHIRGAASFNAKKLIEKLGGKASRSTVYRILSRLLKRGLIHEFTDDEGVVWYAKCKKCSSEGHFDDHPHFKCIYCGKIECVDDIKVDISNPSKRAFFSQTVFLKGECESCQKNTAQNA